MKIDLHVQEANSERIVPIHFSDDETVEHLVERIEADAGVDGLSIIGMATDVQQFPEIGARLGDFKFKHPTIHVHRVCVNVHFEGDEAKHYFPVHAPWSRVHRWACRKFKVSNTAAANLELHEGSAEGPVINERKEIGASDGCKEVWLVKPGPENNG